MHLFISLDTGNPNSCYIDIAVISVAQKIKKEKHLIHQG